uniref:Hypotheticial protein n=1 Tax=Schistosoma japonicum TaxID=6182 RepID=C1L4A1_SCHJA|nr:hypotheticial protein [Schistosoma japonicum]
MMLFLKILLIFNNLLSYTKLHCQLFFPSLSSPLLLLALHHRSSYMHYSIYIIEVNNILIYVKRFVLDLI